MWFVSIVAIVAGHGLGVIGGDTVNLVGLGGCQPHGECLRPRLGV